MKYDFITELRYNNLNLGVFNVVSNVFRGVVTKPGCISFNKDIIRIADKNKEYIIKYTDDRISISANDKNDDTHEALNMYYEKDLKNRKSFYYIDYVNFDESTDLDKGIYEWVDNEDNKCFRFFDGTTIEFMKNVSLSDSKISFGDKCERIGIIPDKTIDFIDYDDLAFINETLKDPRYSASRYINNKVLEKRSN